MKVLDLFSGIGGFSLGLERAGMETVAFCEIEEYPCKILNKHWPDVPIHNDVRRLDGKEYRGSVDVVCGGFPCQPFSVAGKQAGEEDDRHLWPEMLRIISESKPTWVIGENVGGFVDMAFDDCASDLENEGYSVTAFVIPACAVNAPHRRDRVWIVAHSDTERCDSRSDNRQKRPIQGEQIRDAEEDKPERDGRESGISQNPSITTNTISDRPQRELRQDSREKTRPFEAFFTFPGQQWGEQIHLPTPRISRSHDGLPNRSHRIKALGNAVVPQIPEIIGRMIMELENES